MTPADGGVGVLALQGDFAAHAALLRALGAPVREVRRPAQLEGLRALVIPGGESSTLLKLMEGEPWFEAIRALVGRGAAVLGTCAGAILLARTVMPAQPSLGVLDIGVDRNAYGPQVESFEADLEVPSLGPKPMRAAFIRAPRIRDVGERVEVLARKGDAAVLVRQGRVMAATFHPEITGDDRLHRELLAMITSS